MKLFDWKDGKRKVSKENTSADDYMDLRIQIMKSRGKSMLHTRNKRIGLASYNFPYFSMFFTDNKLRHPYGFHYH